MEKLLNLYIRLLHYLFRSFELPSNSPQEAQNASVSPVPAPAVPNPTPMPTVPPTVPESENVPANPDTLLPWDTTGILSHANWHNVRVLCDLKGLDRIQSTNGPFTLKEELCATVWGESEFKVHLVHPNYVFKKEIDANGNPITIRVVSTTDYGIAQWNDWFHGKEISPQVANNDPVTAINLMCDYFLAGRQDQWCAHSNGSYKQHLGKTL